MVKLHGGHFQPPLPRLYRLPLAYLLFYSNIILLCTALIFEQMFVLDGYRISFYLNVCLQLCFCRRCLLCNFSFSIFFQRFGNRHDRTFKFLLPYPNLYHDNIFGWLIGAGTSFACYLFRYRFRIGFPFCSAIRSLLVKTVFNII